VDLGERIGLRHNPRRRVGDAHIERLACANHVIKSAHHFLDWRHEIPGMNPIEVDVIGFESL